jgi:hypothetical protein
LLWGFNLAQAKDENGNLIPIDFSTDGLVPGALSNVKPFKCCIALPCLADSKLLPFVVLSTKRFYVMNGQKHKRLESTSRTCNGIRFKGSIDMRVSSVGEYTYIDLHIKIATVASLYVVNCRDGFVL